MNHQEAVQSNAAEKYFLGELSGDLCEQFEEHYFDCLECAENLKLLASFAGASRICFKEKADHKMPKRFEGTWHKSWFAWLQPAVAAPAILLLAAVAIFQATGVIPSLRERIQEPQLGQVYESEFRLQGIVRGENITKIAIRPNETFGLELDFTPAGIFPSYKADLTDRSGISVRTFDISGDMANRTIKLAIPGEGLHPGPYELIFVGRNAAGKAESKSNAVLRLPFIIDFRS
jgi:hypothetical protein